MPKRIQAAREAVTKGQAYDISAAIELAKELSTEKFEARVDMSLKIGVDPRKHMVKGVSQLPHGTGKSVKVMVFCEGEEVAKATEAGAEKVGLDELIAEIQSGDVNVSEYDVCIATPSCMKQLSKVARILGPKGLMPNAKLGTVTPDTAACVAKVKKGQVQFAVEKGSLVHSTIGSVKFNTEQLIENIKQLVADIKKAKPSAAKGQYLQKLHISTTMGPGIQVDLSTVN